MDTLLPNRDPSAAHSPSRLSEAEETLRAIRNGEVDAVVVTSPQGDQVFTRHGAEQTYRMLVEQMNEAALLLAFDGTVLYADPAFAILTNLPLDRVIGARWGSFFVPPDDARAKRLLSRTRHTCARREMHVRREGGVSPRPVAVSIASLKSQGVDGFAAVLADLTEQKAVQAQLRESNSSLEMRVKERTSAFQEGEERFRIMADGTPMAIWVTDGEGRIQFVNRAYADFFGTTPAEAHPSESV